MSGRSNGGRFTEGNKGGPGRPKGPSRIKELESFCDSEGAEIILEMARGGRRIVDPVNGQVRYRVLQEGTQLEALKLVFAYGKGKPPQSLTLKSDDNLRDFIINNAGRKPGVDAVPGKGPK